MKSLRVLSIFFFMSGFTAHAGDLKSFCEGLDKTLRHFNNPRYSCQEDSRLTVSSARLTKFQDQSVTVMTEQDAQKLFKELQSHTEIPYDFSLAGCEERAQEMSRLMLLKGITPLKSFASVDESKAPRLEIPHPRKKGEKIRWKYHVAPTVLVEKNGELIPYTLDPSMEKQAVPTLQWKEDMTRHNPKMDVRVQYTPASQYDVDGRILRDPRDPEFTKSNQESLKELKKLSQDPEGEAEWMFRQELMEDKLNSLPGY